MNAVERDDKLLADQDLVQRAASGAEEARQELVLQLWPRVQRLTRHLCRGSQECEDLCQEVMVQILRSARSYRAEGCVEAWADAITVRNVLKRQGRSRRRDSLIHLASEPPSPRVNGEAVLGRRQLDAQVRDLLEHLDPQRRAALVLKLAWGFSVDEVAETMDASPATVRYWLKSGRAELRQRARRERVLEEAP